MWESINLSSKVSISRWFQIFVGLVMWDWAEDNMLRHTWAKMYFCRHYFKKLIKIIDCCVTELIALWFPLHFVYSSPAPQDYGAHIFTPASYKTLTSSKILHVLTQTYFVQGFRLLVFLNCHILPHQKMYLFWILLSWWAGTIIWGWKIFITFRWLILLTVVVSELKCQKNRHFIKNCCVIMKLVFFLAEVNWRLQKGIYSKFCHHHCVFNHQSLKTDSLE